jgi:non-ribosomal peptide synthetase component F
MDLRLHGCVNLGQAFERVVELRPGHTALAYPTGERISYAELNDRVDRIAAGLLARGVKARQVVALFNHKSPDGIAAQQARRSLREHRSVQSAGALRTDPGPLHARADPGG